MPDPDERWSNPGERDHWQASRNALARLGEKGGTAATPRPVDHRMEFPSVEAAELFLEAAQLRGYQPLAHADRGLGEEPFALSLRRVDSVELDHIHRVVMDLVELAAPYDGDHVGWCSSST